MLKSIAIATVVYAGVALPAIAATDDPAARAAIAQAWHKYRQGVQNEQELIEVQIEHANQAQVTKTLWRRTQYGEQTDKLSIKFVAPAADNGLGLLVERNPNAGDQIWLRLPSWSSGRKVIGNRETKYFADTAFTFEDSKQLIGEQTASFDYHFGMNGNKDGKSDRANGGDIIVAWPKQGIMTGYGRRHISLNAQGVPIRIEYFDVNGDLIKTLSFEDIVFPAPGRWRANRIVLKHHRQPSQTVLKVVKRQFNLGMSELMFSLPYLLESEHAKAD